MQKPIKDYMNVAIIISLTTKRKNRELSLYILRAKFNKSLIISVGKEPPSEKDFSISWEREQCVAVALQKGRKLIL